MAEAKKRNKENPYAAMVSQLEKEMVIGGSKSDMSVDSHTSTGEKFEYYDAYYDKYMNQMQKYEDKYKAKA